MSTPAFNNAYYRKTITEAGYDTDFFEGFSEDLPNVDRLELEQMFLCHKGLYDFRDSPDEKAILTGFGLSGVPHLGTLSQMHRASVLNGAGYFTETVLGDLDAYNGKGTSFPRVRQLSAVYGRFLAESGMFDPANSRVRDQYSHPEVLRTAYQIGRYASDALLEDTEEDLHDFYAANGKVDDKMSFPRKLSLNLMMADFFDLGQTRPDVLVMLGLDEHKYVRAAQTLSELVPEVESGIKPVKIRSIYTPIIKGLKGYPKMSKSFVGSGITLDMPEAAVRDAIMEEPDDFEDASGSVVMQIANGIGVDGMTISEAAQAATERNNDWNDVKHAVIQRICGFSALWQEVSVDLR